MRPLIPILNAHYPFHFDALELLRDSGCMAFAAFAGRERFFLRVVKPTFAASAQSALDVQLFLQAQGFPVPSVIRTRAGEAAVHFSDGAAEYHLVLCAYLEGVEADPENDIEAIGALTGRLHRLMRGYSGTLVQRGKAYYIDRYLEQLRRRDYPRTAEFAAYGEALWKKFSPLTRGPVHADLYSGNILKTADGTLYLLDFDTFCEGIMLYDPALICNGSDYFQLSCDACEKTRELFARFLPQYRRFHPLAEEEAAALYDVIALYHFTLQATILEIHGLHCVDFPFFDRQLAWLYGWQQQCKQRAKP